MFIILEFLMIYVIYSRVSAALKKMLEFHDYLIQYRLTPKSRILRKHLPKMTMVLEEESNMDTSSMMMSQSRLMSVSHKTSHKRKFVFYEHQEPGSPLGRTQDIEPSESSSDEYSDDGDLEQDLSMLDNDQAELVRKINKMGSRSVYFDRSASRFSQEKARSTYNGKSSLHFTSSRDF